MIRSFLLGLLLAAPISAETWRVVPGQGVGPVSLGQSYVDVNKVLTPKEALGDLRQGYLRYREGIDVECTNQKVTQIFVNQTSFQGKAGPIEVQVEGNLKIGSSASQVESALGRVYEARDLKVHKSQPREVYYAFRSKGLGVLVRGGKVAQFIVWPRR